jgi:hypothetical protein
MGSGLFQSNFILSTLALHLIATDALDDDVKSTKYPEGALLLSVVAVSCFLLIYIISNSSGTVRACLDAVHRHG